MSDNFGNTRDPCGYPTDTRQYPGNDNSEKCASITDEQLDSGIASITLSDIERNRFVDEKLGDSQRLDSGLDSGIGNVLDSAQLDSGMCLETRKKEQKFESPDCAKTDEDRLDSGLLSFSAEDTLYEPYIPHDDGLSPLHIAILDKNVTEALNMIEDVPEPAALDFFTPEIHTSLHLAVYSNLPEVVRFLVIYGANFNSKDQKGNTALHTACELGRHSCVRTLLSPLDGIENIGFQKLRIPQDINEKNYEGLTPLHLATINNQWQVVSLLVQHPDINVNIGDSTSGRTALHHALERRHTQCFLQILKGSVNVNAITYAGCSPLHVAVGLELEQETRFLMTRGADIGIETNEKIRALDLARTQKIKDALQYSILQMHNRAIKQR